MSTIQLKSGELTVTRDGQAMKLSVGDAVVQVISLEAPLGQALLGKCEGDEVRLPGGSTRAPLEVLWAQ